MIRAKYRLTSEYRSIDGRRVYRIQATRDFKTRFGRWVKSGDLGGFVEGEENLSHSGKCWIFDLGGCWSGGRIEGDAVVSDMAWIYNGATVSDGATVSGSVMIRGRSKVSGNARVGGCVVIDTESTISENAIIFGDFSLEGVQIRRGYLSGAV